MKLNELFSYLTTGELAQVFVGDLDSDGVLVEGAQLPIVQSIQLGLTALHKRFNLKNKEITIQLLPGKTVFPLKSQYLTSSPNANGVKYIEDSIEYPFKDDLLKIERVLTTDGYELAINSSVNRYSAHTPSVDTLVIPHELATDDSNLPEQLKVDKLKVVYRANHPNLVPKIGPLISELVNIDLPTQYLQALLYFVASRKTNPIGMTNEFNTGNNWYQKYELECQQLQNEGMAITEDLSNAKFRRNGWT